MILKENIDINELFSALDMSKDKELDVNELGVFLHRVDKDLTREEIEYLFNKFDDDGSNSISFEEFKKWLEENDCRMSKS
jgi:Ca2+-binding EF-hand superfamily protein